MPKAYHTSLASEFYVISVLHRLGVDATLTLGNRKGIDIVALSEEGDATTIEVKGTRGTTGWWVNNVKAPRVGHYIVFIGYKNKIVEVDELPDDWIVPSERLDDFVRPNPNNRVVGPERLKEFGAQFKGAWHLITR